MDACDTPPNVNEENPQNSFSYLWNAMMHPFTRHNVYGGIWYQGESNKVYNNEKYNCSLPALIGDWRAKWRGSDPIFPFGVVQLGTDVDNGGVTIRWHQTADYGYTPSTTLENVFMAVAFDTYDEEGGVHSRYKQIIGERLSISGGNIAYGFDTPTNGPFPESFTQIDGNQVEILYDQPFTYNNLETSGFWICCQEFDACNNQDDWGWYEMVKSNVTAVTEESKVMVDLTGLCDWTGEVAVGNLAYMWADKKVKGYLGAPIYADDEYRLPAAPWAHQLQ